MIQHMGGMPTSQWGKMEMGTEDESPVTSNTVKDQSKLKLPVLLGELNHGQSQWSRARVLPRDTAVTLLLDQCLTGLICGLTAIGGCLRPPRSKRTGDLG